MPTSESLPPHDGLAALFANAGKAARSKGPPPVERWSPPDCGPIDMRIAADGSWFYMGSPIGREAMVRLFASVLRKDPDGFTYLVTPVEKCRIRVDDAPFTGVELHVAGEAQAQTLTLRTNVGDIVTLDAEHGLRFAVDRDNGGIRPYVLVRGALEARLTRSVTHQLMDLGTEHDIGAGRWFGVWSAGAFFPIQPVEGIA